jgi:transposase
MNSLENPAKIIAELSQENTSLKQLLAALKPENATLKVLLHEALQRIDYLIEKQRLDRQRLFGASSEKNSSQLNLFNEAESAAEEAPPATADTEPESESASKPTPKKRAGRRPLPAHLERRDVVHDLSEDEKICSTHGTPLRCIGEDVTEQLEYQPAKLIVLRHIRKKYVCDPCNTAPITAPKPAQPIEKSIASPSLLAFVAVSKYADGMPLYRQANNLFARLDIDVDRTTLANWMIAGANVLQPVFNFMQDHLLARSLIHMDETPLQVLKEPDKTAQSQSYMWVQCSDDGPSIRLFHYSPTRNQSVPQARLLGFSGALMVDGYDGYQPACDAQQLIRLGCWQHARRKFVEVQKSQAKGNSNARAEYVLGIIAKLYQLETQARNKGFNAEQRHALRQEKARPLIEKLRQWLDTALLQTLPKSKLGEALGYLNNQWPRLVRYLDNGAYPIDNNPAENAIRPFVIGRKNWLFANSQAGAHASAIWYSLIETAKANQKEPYAYLTKLLTDLPNVKTVEDIEALLPWNVK